MKIIRENAEFILFVLIICLPFIVFFLAMNDYLMVVLTILVTVLALFVMSVSDYVTK